MYRSLFVFAVALCATSTAFAGEEAFTLKCNVHSIGAISVQSRPEFQEVKDIQWLIEFPSPEQAELAEIDGDNFTTKFQVIKSPQLYELYFQLKLTAEFGGGSKFMMLRIERDTGKVEGSDYDGVLTNFKARHKYTGNCERTAIKF
jgi:hypothetical protein